MSAAFNANIPFLLICISLALLLLNSVFFTVKRMPTEKDVKMKRLYNYMMAQGLYALLILYVLVIIALKQIINSNYIFVDVAFGLANTFLLYRYFMVWLKTR